MTENKGQFYTEEGAKKLESLRFEERKVLEGPNPLACPNGCKPLLLSTKRQPGFLVCGHCGTIIATEVDTDEEP